MDGSEWSERERKHTCTVMCAVSHTYVCMYVHMHTTHILSICFICIHTYVHMCAASTQSVCHPLPPTFYHLLLLHSATPCVCVCTYVMHIKYICMDVWMYVCTNCEKHSKIKEKPTDIRVKLTEKQKRWSIKQGKPPKKKRKNKKKTRKKEHKNRKCKKGTK